jgi:selenide,water dikinase
LANLNMVESDSVLAGLDRPDDAGVVQVRPDLALIQTIDFFTPIVDDPYLFGRIAAANSLSDVYAMGGTPISALNVVCFPAKDMDMSVLRRIMEGGLDTLREANCPLVGGHSVDDPELKYGLSVTGTVHPDRYYGSDGARAGDALVLTKPLGTALVTTAHKRGVASAEAMDAAVAAMSRLNRRAAEVASTVDVHACTDVTGFSLLGHAHEMIADSSCHLVIDAARVPALPGALDYARDGHLCGGLGRNRDHFGCHVAFDENVADEVRSLLFDPQTSGGLLIAVSPADAERIVTELRADDHDAAVIGHVADGDGGTIRVIAGVAT